MTPILPLLHAAHALVGQRWERDVRMAVDSRGVIASLDVGASSAGCERLAGPVIPAMPNAHSHAFQRGLSGRTGRSAGDDSFWTWRTAMYDFVARLDPDAFEAIAAQAYAEMAVAGYSCVAEFHYVHHDPDGNAYAEPGELAQRIVAAAARAGIALTLLPVFYANSGFGSAPPGNTQRRFINSPEQFAALVAGLAKIAGHDGDGFVLGIAPHSLRAVSPGALHQVLAAAPVKAPIHIHAAEQQREVKDCIAWSGERPVEWLLNHADVDARWAIVHATHTTIAERDGVIARGATVLLAPTTEADLGDGTFAAEHYLKHGGAMAIGSDSNTVIDPFAELRQLEYSQRLATQRRNVLGRSDTPVGSALWQSAAAGGAQACGRAAGTLAVGMRADLVVLDADEPALAGLEDEAALEAAIFGPCRTPVRDTLIGGRVVVRNGRHVQGEDILRAYRAALARILR
jgi:formimidoylglutamate deiminase